MTLRSYSALGMLLPPIIIMVQDYSQALDTENACRVYPVESGSRVEFVLSITFITIYEIACIQLARWS